MDRFYSCIPIPVECGTSINHVAFDGCDYFCTVRCECAVIRFDSCHNTLHKLCTCREYDCICYDYCDHCFWASSRSCNNRLYKLDCSMNEIDCISICTPGEYGNITGISYNCCKNALIVSLTCAVIEVRKCCEKIGVLYTTKEAWILGVLSICPGMLITVFKENRYCIEAIDSCGKRVACYCADCSFIPKNLIFNPCNSACRKGEIWVFGLKRGDYPYLCKCDRTPEDWGIEPCCCNYEICTECCCDNGCSPCEDIMESIAMIEAALSHILNAEGEKIQKVLATTDDIDKIMCVNREVNKTIVNVTHLEQTLYAKLSALSDCGLCGELCDGCKQDCCDDMPQEQG